MGSKQHDQDIKAQISSTEQMEVEKTPESQAISDRVALLDERTMTLNERTQKMMDMMCILLEGRPKREQEENDYKIDANSLGPASKKADKKTTPKKKSPPFERATRNQNP